VKDTAGKHPLKVCILSPHPLVLAEFSRVLSPPVFEALTSHLDSMLAPELRRLELPQARVYVVDACGPQHVTAALIANVREHSPSARLLIVSEEFNSVESHDLLRLAAKGLLTYAEAPEQLPRALPIVAAGGFLRALLSALSQREQEVLDALLENLVNKEIGSRLNISERTVKFHVSNILTKFGVRRRADLILLCYQERKSPVSV
jgi:DNA-binding NarL/FixJ family response regulator